MFSKQCDGATLLAIAVAAATAATAFTLPPRVQTPRLLQAQPPNQRSGAASTRSWESHRRKERVLRRGHRAGHLVREIHVMKATELHARLGGTLHRLSAPRRGRCTSRAGGRRRRRASTRSGNRTRPRGGKSWSLTGAATRTATRGPSATSRTHMPARSPRRRRSRRRRPAASSWRRATKPSMRT